MPRELMMPFAPAALACLALLLAGCKPDAKIDPSAATRSVPEMPQAAEVGAAEHAPADFEAQVADVDGTEADDADEVVLDDEDLDNAEVLPSETTNLFASAAEQLYREELQARAAARKQEKEQQGAETQEAGTLATAAAEPTAPLAPAMEEKAILQEKNGQWAATAEASSTYGDASGKGGYTAWQATGAPNVPRYSDHVDSWATKHGDSATPDWLQLGFARPVHATSIRIRQNAAPGAISRIELLDTDGGTHTIWEGTDTTAYRKNTIGWLARDFDATPYQVNGARITLESNRVWGWNEIDAVQLVGEAN